MIDRLLRGKVGQDPSIGPDGSVHADIVSEMKESGLVRLASNPTPSRSLPSG